MIQEKLHIPGGEERLSWYRKSLGRSCHGDDKLSRWTLHRILRVSSWYQFGEKTPFHKLIPGWNM
jgi:hypothetical protein